VKSFALLLLAGCWTGSGAPQEPPRPSGAVNRLFPTAEIRAIRRCAANGPEKLLLTFYGNARDGEFDVEILFAPKDVVPKTVVDGDKATFSPCRLHGCSAAMLTIDELAIGTRARGRFRVAANAGPSFADEFEARWVGTPWAVYCPSDNI